MKKLAVVQVGLVTRDTKKSFMKTTVLEKTWTEKELISLPKNGYKHELTNGELVMIPAGMEHENIVIKLSAASQVQKLNLIAASDHQIVEPYFHETIYVYQNNSQFPPLVCELFGYLTRCFLTRTLTNAILYLSQFDYPDFA